MVTGRSPVELDEHAVARRTRQRRVSGDHGRVQRLGQREVRGVKYGHVVPQLPDPVDKAPVWIAPYTEAGKIAEGRLGACARQASLADEPAEPLDDLDIQQLRGVQRLAGRADPRSDPFERTDREEVIDRGGGVEDDQEASR